VTDIIYFHYYIVAMCLEHGRLCSYYSVFIDSALHGSNTPFQSFNVVGIH